MPDGTPKVGVALADALAEKDAEIVRRRAPIAASGGVEGE